MSNKTRTWSRLLALFGTTVVAFAFAIVLSPGALAAALTSTNVEPATLVAGASGTATITFTTATSLPVDGKIKVTFGAGYDVSGAAGATCSTMDGSFATSVSSQIVTITRSGGTIEVAGAQTCTIGTIVNSTTAGATGVYGIQTTSAGDVEVDVDAAVTADTIVAGAATKLMVTGTGTQVTGAENELTVTATDAYDNTDTTYTGDKALVFSGPAASPDGSIATVEAINIGSTTTTAFLLGVTDGATLTLVAKKVEAATTVDVTDGSLTSTGAADDLDLAVTIGAAAKVMVATLPSTSIVVSQTFSTQPVVNVTDTYGNTVTGNTSTVTAAMYSDAACSASGAGILSGTTKAAVAGVATFTALSHDAAGTYYLGFADGALTAACTGDTATMVSLSASTVTIVGASSSSRVVDNTAPAVASDIEISINSANQVVLTWTDPADTDYSSVEILRGKNVASVVEISYASVDQGLETYTDTGVSLGDEMKYVLLVEDTSGNVSRSDVQSITVAADAITTTTVAPATTTTTTTTQTQTQSQNRYGQAGVTETQVDSAVSSFSDLLKDAWHAPFIARMRNMAVLSGYSDGTVKPDNTINRAELAKIAAKAFDLSSATETFSDVADDSWFAPFVGALQSAGAVWTTTSDYQPSGDVTRGEALQTLLVAAGVDLDGVDSAKLFPDVGTKHRFAAAITYASQNGVVSGYDNGNFGPGDTLTRGQVAKIVSLIKDL